MKANLKGRGHHQLLRKILYMATISAAAIASNAALKDDQAKRQKDDEDKLKPTITKANSSFVFVHTAKLEAEMNFGHIRISVAMEDLQTMKKQICNHQLTMKQITQHLIQSQHSQHGKMFATALAASMKIRLEANCATAAERIILAEEIFQRSFGKRNTAATAAETTTTRQATTANPNTFTLSALKWMTDPRHKHSKWVTTSMKSCTEACKDQELECTAEGLNYNNKEVDTSTKLLRLVQRLNSTSTAPKCSNLEGYSFKSPSFTSSECLTTAPDRIFATEDCTRPEQTGRSKLCYCHATGLYKRKELVDQAKTTSPHCYWRYIHSLGGSINDNPSDRHYGAGQGRQNTVYQCHQLCQQRRGCQYFTYLHNNKHCWLRSNLTTNWKFNEDVSAGPRECEKFIKNRKATTPPAEAPKERKKRFVLAVIAGAAVAGGLALGAYNTIEIEKLSSKVNQQQQQLQHIIVSLDKMTELMEQNIHDIENIRTKVNQLTKETKKMQEDNMLMDLAQHVMDTSNKELSNLQSTIEGIFQSLSGTVPPHLLNGIKLREAFLNMKKKSTERGFTMTQKEIAHLFQLPVSVILHENNQLDIIIHCPLRLQEQTMDIYKLQSLPFILEGIPDKSYTINTENRYLGTNSRKTSIIELSSEDINVCSRVSDVYYCPDLIQRHAIPENSCVISLYRHEHQNIMQSCDIVLAPTRTKIVRVTHYEAFMSTQGTKIFYKCNPANNPTRAQSGSLLVEAGTFRIQTSKEADCIISTRSFSYRAFRPLEEAMRFEPITIQTNFLQMLNMTREQMKAGIELIEKHQTNKPMKIKEIKMELEAARGTITATSQINGLTIALAITATVVLIIACCTSSAAAWYLKTRHTVAKQANNWLKANNAPPSAPQNAQGDLQMANLNPQNNINQRNQPLLDPV